MRAHGVTLLLCMVCGLTLHAGDSAARGFTLQCDASSSATEAARWRPRDPSSVFTVHSNWSPAAMNRSARHRRSLPDAPTMHDGVLTVFNSAAGDLPIPATPSAAASPVDFYDDLRGFLPGVWRDARGVVRTENVLILSTALAAAIGIRQDLDGEVRDDVADHPSRWGDASRMLGRLGEAPVQVPVLGLLWGVSLWTKDAELNGLSHTLFSAYAINGLTVLAIKGIADTDRPDGDWNGGRWGFPSFHAASSFTIAGVLEEYYGWRAGLPAYTLAGLISWSRIDEQDHDLSDVVFGAALGWVIGKSVAGQHLRGDGRVLLMPWAHPLERANGVMLEVRY